NPSTIVTKSLKNGERLLTEAFLRFKNHYGFTAAFCNLNSGHEKGSVETKVGYHRRNLLVPVPQVDDLREFNRHLLEQCDLDMQRPHYRKEALIKDLFGEDRGQLLPLPAVPFDEAALVTVRTDSYAKFTLNKGKHTYSTAPRYANTTLLVRLTAHEVIVLDENHREVQRHPRLYGDTPQQSMDWLPYLTQLARRPAALKYTGIYNLLPGEVKTFLDRCDGRGKRETLQVLARLSREADFTRATEALKAALDYGAKDVDSILATFSRLNSQVLELDPLVLPNSVPQMPSCRPRIDHYDRFLKGGRNLETTNC
ncbi:MAG: Mu transposase domain-containing protein, partial [Bacillota bacterium]